MIRDSHNVIFFLANRKRKTAGALFCFSKAGTPINFSKVSVPVCRVFFCCREEQSRQDKRRDYQARADFEHVHKRYLVVVNTTWMDKLKINPGQSPAVSLSAAAVRSHGYDSSIIVQ